MTVAPQEKTGDVLQLDWQTVGGDSVTVTSKDRHRFNVKLRRAIEILQIAQDAGIFEDQLQLLMSQLGDWLRARTDIREAFLTIQDVRLLFVVIRKEVEYNDAFEDELSELDWAIAHDSDLDKIHLSCLALPPASSAAISSFQDKQFVLSYNYGIGSQPH